MTLLFSILIVGAVIGILDALWLTLVAKKLYSAEVGGIMRKKPSAVASAVFYVIYVVGVAVLIVMPDVHGSTEWYISALRGGLFGLVAYATFSLTNLAVFKPFTLKVALPDIAWGAVMTAVAVTVATLVL